MHKITVTRSKDDPKGPGCWAKLEGSIGDGSWGEGPASAIGALVLENQEKLGISVTTEVPTRRTQN